MLRICRGYAEDRMRASGRSVSPLHNGKNGERSDMGWERFAASLMLPENRVLFCVTIF